jgi:hypothetical protein
MISTGIDNGRALRNNDPSILQERGESFKDSPCATRREDIELTDALAAYDHIT